MSISCEVVKRPRLKRKALSIRSLCNPMACRVRLGLGDPTNSRSLADQDTSGFQGIQHGLSAYRRKGHVQDVTTGLRESASGPLTVASGINDSKPDFSLFLSRVETVFLRIMRMSLSSAATPAVFSVPAQAALLASAKQLGLEFHTLSQRQCTAAFYSMPCAQTGIAVDARAQADR